MKTHITTSIVAALALAFVVNLHAQTPAGSGFPAGTAARDPFAASKPGAPAGGMGSAPMLPGSPGTSQPISGLPFGSSGTSQPIPGTPPLAPVPEAQAEDTDAMNISLTYEAFSLPIAKAGEIQRKGMSDAELYKELVTTGKLERMLVLRGKSGQRALLENVTEYRFATEFTTPQDGDAEERPKATNDGAKADEPVAPAKTAKGANTMFPAMAVAFDVKRVGDSLEVEPVLSRDAKIVDLNLSITHTALVGRSKWGQGLSEVEQPQFETQKVNTNASFSIGAPLLIGTLNPVFGNGVTQRGEQNVWFCFITPTLTRASGDSAKKSAH